MSVIMTLLLSGDPKKMEEYAASHQDLIRSISDDAKKHGVLAHRFYGSDDGKIMVVDEWPDAESFQTFFSGNADKIGPMMADVGVTSEPEVTFWRKLETYDEVGWD
jgi:hypothetical protein